ncbi:hypothetical protein F5Y18DRAFT_112261 [Xylariaceae sp. FL1019]|nr:hypothetical protein F5Y18DRAFT_112261 [Xylariaceae sp. FL1019]
MPRCNVIVDSEDEDELGGFSPETSDNEAETEHPEPEPEPGPEPEPEPLSQNPSSSVPGAHEGRTRSSDKTDPSLFADIYDEHQSLAVEQSQLIENIVLQSQKASRSSGEASLAAKPKGRHGERSSGTDATTPIVLSRHEANERILSDEASDFATPHTTRGDEWDIPSSAEAAMPPPRSTKTPKGKQKTYGKKRKSGSAGSSPAVAGTFMLEEAQAETPVQDTSMDHLAYEGEGAETPSLPTVKRRKVSLHGTSTLESKNFYVAPSNLTTMQKLEYQKVNVPATTYSGFPGSLNNKSSGASTVAYSTPSGYSSIPPLPWEKSPAQRADLSATETIDIISSSPDALAAGADDGIECGATHVSIPGEDDQTESIIALAQTQNLASGKKEKAPRLETDEADELSVEDMFDSNEIGLPRELYKPRPSRRRSAAAPTVASEVGFLEEDIEPLTDAETAVEPTASLDPISAPAEKEQAELPPKKRGRKKKQPVVVDDTQEVDLGEDKQPIDEVTSVADVVEEEVPAEKPRKKRGRPRKGSAKPVVEVVPEADQLAGQAEEDTEIQKPSLRKKDHDKRASKKKKMVMDSEDEEEVEIEETKPVEKKLPLKEQDRNSMSPSKSPGKKPEIKDEVSTPKPQAKDAKVPASQSKAIYRVGLSKKSRIAPLLKIIKK